MAQLFDPMLKPGTTIDPVTGEVINELDVLVDPLGPARTGDGMAAIGGAPIETVAQQIAQPAPGAPAGAIDIPVEPIDAVPASVAPTETTVPSTRDLKVDEVSGLPIGPYGPTSAPDLDVMRYEMGYRPAPVKEKSGQVSETTSQKEMTPEAQAALFQLASSQKEIQAAKQIEMGAVKQEQDALGELEKKTAEITGKWKTAEADQIAKENREIERLLTEADTRQRELASMDRKDFWGSRSEGQRWATALSIGLGSFGQALTGSGQNVGSVILQQRIDQFNRIQDQQFDQKKAEIEGLRMSASKRKEMLAAYEKEFDARKLSELSKIEAELKPRIAAAKTPQMQAKLMRDYSAIEDNKAKTIADIADKYAAQKSETRTQEIYKTVAGKATYPEGENASKAQQWVSMAQAFAPMSRAFKENPRAFDTPETRRYYSQMLVTEGAEAVPFGAGKTLDRLIDAGFVRLSAEDPELANDPRYAVAQERFARENPEAYNFFQQQRSIAAGLIRGDTGAAITADEWKLAYDQYLVLPWDTPEQAARKMAAAAARIQLLGKATGLL